MGPSWITERLIFAAANAANISATQTQHSQADEGDNHNGNTNNDDVLDAATRQEQVAATAAAFLKSMNEDELLQVVPEEPNNIATSSSAINVDANGHGGGHKMIEDKKRFLHNPEMNQIHDDLYRQLTGTPFAIITPRAMLFSKV